jgi:DNA-binding helix-hairpin-helix protein with protein kinase domain
VRSRRTPAANCEFGLQVVRVIAAALESLKAHGQAVKVPTT